MISVRKSLAQVCMEATVWSVRPFQIVSLLEMLKHNANLFYFITRNLQTLETKTKIAIDERGGMSLLTEREINQTRKLIERIEGECKKLRLDDVLNELHAFDLDHLQPFPGLTRGFVLEQLRVELEKLSKKVAESLSNRLFMVIPADEAGYYNHPELFGSEVAAKFPKANKEITEAGNCYATGNHTACVFHLMRAVELGARCMIRRLKVKTLHHRVELCDWGSISTALNDAVKNLPKRKSLKASETSAFYSHAVAQFFNFKDAWRNQVSHTRDVYDEHVAMNVMVNTRQFIQHLATRLKE